MSDQLSTSFNVDHLNTSDRHTLEGLLGKSLDRGQQVLILAYTPNVAPSADDKAKAKTVIDQYLAKAQNNIAAQNISESEVEEIIDEAIENIRPRK